MLYDMTTPKLISREQAKAERLTHYYTGEQCKNGHLSLRYTSTAGCLACLNVGSAAWMRQHSGKTLFPAQYVHVDDLAQLYAAVDYLNGQRGFPPATRPETTLIVQSEFETYILKMMDAPLDRRLSVDDMERAAKKYHGWDPVYQSMPRPVDTWTPTPQEQAKRIAQMRADIFGPEYVTIGNRTVDVRDLEGFTPDELQPNRTIAGPRPGETVTLNPTMRPYAPGEATFMDELKKDRST